MLAAFNKDDMKNGVTLIKLITDKWITNINIQQ